LIHLSQFLQNNRGRDGPLSEGADAVHGFSLITTVFVAVVSHPSSMIMPCEKMDLSTKYWEKALF